MWYQYMITLTMTSVSERVLLHRSLMVEHLSKVYQLSSNTGVTFIYCNYKDPQTPATYIRLAIKQLCRRMGCLPLRLQETYEKHYRNDSQPNTEELQSVFLAVARRFHTMFLVLDALDECPQGHREELCEFFSNIVELSATSSQGQDNSISAPTAERRGLISDIHNHLALAKALLNHL